MTYPNYGTELNQAATSELIDLVNYTYEEAMNPKTDRKLFWEYRRTNQSAHEILLKRGWTFIQRGNSLVAVQWLPNIVL